MPPVILIVDDELEFSSTLSERLQLRGFSTIMATDGYQALELLTEKVPDLAIVDLKMPQMNGIELLRHIRSQLPDLPVILLTGRGTTSDGIQSMRLGAADFLTKPTDIEALISRINEFLA